MALDKEEVARIAALARIRLRDDELAPLAGELSRIIGWVEQLAEVNTDNVPPMTSVAAIPRDGPRGPVARGLPMRDDVVTDGDCRDAILGNAPQATHGFLAVPKVIE